MNDGKFEVGDKVKFTGFAYLYDGLDARGTHKISNVCEDGHVSFAEDKRSSPWEINPSHIKLVTREKKRKRNDEHLFYKMHFGAFFIV